MSGFDGQGFEGSYLGNREVLRPGSRLECKICWWVYDPATGDPQWQIAPGTPFADLPALEVAARSREAAATQSG